jgi:hypothetical protein
VRPAREFSVVAAGRSDDPAYFASS